MKKLLLVLLGVVGVFALVGCGSKDSGEKIYVYNWGEYIDESLLDEFTKETGIKVIYDTFPSNEDMYVKIKQSSDNIDVTVPSDYMIERMIEEDMIQKIDFSKIPNFEGVNEGLKNPDFDPTGEFSIPYFWGTTGIIYNAKNITDTIDSWADLWDEEYSGKIVMYNSQRDSIAIALKMLGYSMNSKDSQELEEAKQALIAQKPLVLAYQADEGRDTIVAEEGDIGVMYSGDALFMIQENPNLKYVYPKEGSNLWFDSMVIPNSAQNVEGAHKFIDFMLRPENAAKNAEFTVGYATPVDAARELLPEELKNSEVAYPTQETIDKSEVYRNPKDLISLYDEIWTAVQTAQ
ncbi:MAG: spermidine/putrescine ABC transporter substrate-binding protein [Tissierellia bacterium]|nr:spermidine/putrescine ABC transporter substrate-binding protein [Tissierellia bacterium]